MTYNELIGACEVLRDFCASYEHCTMCPLDSVCSFSIKSYMDAFVYKLKDYG